MLQIVDRPGYFGRKRSNRVEFYDNLFGEGRWAEMWEVSRHAVGFEQAVALYDDAYYVFLAEHPSLIDFICSFGECYDNDPANVLCGCQHDCQSVPRHIQDVSVRRALKRLGVWFDGPSDHLLEIRGEDSNGFRLNPGQVPFHKPELILTGATAGRVPDWAMPGSVEAFWQANKVICTDSLH
jgi:hypothetical protein